jgi:hypothetical protein
MVFKEIVSLTISDENTLKEKSHLMNIQLDWNNRSVASLSESKVIVGAVKISDAQHKLLDLNRVTHAITK